MSALEQVILEKVRQLGEQQQQQVLEFVETLQPAAFDFAAWRAEVDAIHHEIFARHRKNFSIDVQALLDEVREEAS